MGIGFDEPREILAPRIDGNELELHVVRVSEHDGVTPVRLDDARMRDS